MLTSHFHESGTAALVAARRGKYKHRYHEAAKSTLFTSQLPLNKILKSESTAG